MENIVVARPGSFLKNLSLEVAKPATCVGAHTHKNPSRNYAAFWQSWKYCTVMISKELEETADEHRIDELSTDI